LVSSGNELYIISGGWGSQYFIANGHVNVPLNTWKVIVVLPNGSNDVSRVTTSTRMIAVWVPNSGTVNSDWRTYRVSVDQIEGWTGYDFFSNVPASIQSVIEAQLIPEEWPENARHEGKTWGVSPRKADKRAEPRPSDGRDG
jgi:endonuclease G